MDLEILNFLWAILLPVIGWLSSQILKLREEVTRAKERAASGISSQEAHLMVKSEIAEIKTDIKTLTNVINQSMRDFDRRIFEVMIDIANKGQDRNG